MANFTPQQIEEFLQEFFDVVGTRQYTGARYVPIFGRAGEDTVEWDDLAPYEPLTVVMHQGVSYVSRRYVPDGIQITDTTYWVETYRFNAQVEQYRQEVLSFQGQINQLRDDMESDYVPFPDSDTYPKYGNLGQVLTTLTGGETKWEDPVTVDAAIAEPLIEAWLDDHPEATTTVQDGSITTVKLHDDAVTNEKIQDSTITDAKLVETGIKYKVLSVENQLEGRQLVGSDWSLGTATTNKTVNTQQRYAIACTDILITSHETELFVDSGYQFFLQLFDANGDFLSTTSWKTGSYLIPANRQAMVTLTKTPVDPNGTAGLGWKVHVFTESGIYKYIDNTVQPLAERMDATESDITEIENDIGGVSHIGENWIQGVATNAGTINTTPTYALACTEKITALYDTIIYIDSGYQAFLQIFNMNNEYVRTSNWSTTTLEVPANHKYMVTIAETPIDTTAHSDPSWRYNVHTESQLYRYIDEAAKSGTNQWNGKKWFAFGTSISDTTFPMPYSLPGYTGKYPPYLAELSGLQHFNYAIGGSRITDSDSADRNTILQQIQQTDISDVDLITIEGFVNDWSHSAPIGTFEDSTDHTLYGALNLAMTSITSRNPDVTVVLLIDNTGKRWVTPQGEEHPAHLAYYDKNGNDDYQSDYAAAVEEYARHVQVLCIDAGKISQISALHPQYIQDTIHQSELGGKQYANAIWSVLKDIRPNEVQ